MKIVVISLLRSLAKRHEKASKGNSLEPFVYRSYCTLRARVSESEKCVVRRYVRMCVGKLFGTTK